MKYYTLQYTNDYGDTVSRDYFDDIEEAKKFMDELIKNCEYGLILEDSDGDIIEEYYPEYSNEDDYDEEDDEED